MLPKMMRVAPLVILQTDTNGYRTCTDAQIAKTGIPAIGPGAWQRYLVKISLPSLVACRR